jgi:hypothetical protein
MNSKMRIYRFRAARRIILGDNASTSLQRSCATPRTPESIDAVARGVRFASDRQESIRARVSILCLHATLPAMAKKQTP